MFSSSAAGKNVRSNQTATELNENANKPHLPHIRCKDNSRIIPRYTAALRSDDEYLPAEDLDFVQRELETLLANVAIRQRMLNAEYESLDKGDKLKDERYSKGKQVNKDKLPVAAAAITSSTSKRRRDDTNSRRKHNTLPPLKRRKHGGKGGIELGEIADDSKPRALMKSDLPNRFWVSIEPYCMPVTKDDLRSIDELIAEFSTPIALNIPPLGMHYTMQLFKQEFPLGCDASTMIKEAENCPGEFVTGPLIQRLTSALIELPSEQAATAEQTVSNMQAVCMTYKMKNGYQIEKRLKKELAALGILEEEEEEEDEILMNLQRVVAETNSISQQNLKHLQELRAFAEHEIRRNEVQAKLDEVDTAICALHKKMSEVNQQRSFYTPEEENEIYKLTKLQRELVNSLAEFDQIL